VIGEVCEEAAEEVLLPVDILDTYRWCMAEGYVIDEPGKQAWVRDHEAVGRAYQYYLGVPQTFRYVGRLDLGDDGSGSFGSLEDATYFAAYARITSYRIGHFYRSNRVGRRLWDPMWPAGEIAEVLSIRGYRA
jgi:hypothetical protein